jgi:hypothetical protein
VLLTITEGVGNADTTQKQKAATKTVTETVGNLDVLTKFKSAIKTITEGIGNLDVISKFKAATKTILEGLANGDWSQWIPFWVSGKKYNDYPVLRFFGSFPFIIGKSKIGKTFISIFFKDEDPDTFLSKEDE